jgi:outer membrane protein assembly factor BamB
MAIGTRVVATVGALCVAVAAPAWAQQGDWPQWRGPNRDGVAPAAADAEAWPATLTQRWKVEVGLGYATPLVVGDRIYQFARQGEREVMMALDAASGAMLWQTGHEAVFEMMSATTQHGPGPKATPVFHEGRLYSIGMTGMVTAYEADSGRQIWQKPGAPDNLPLFTTHSFSPIIEGRTVIFHLGGSDEGAITAFDLDSGDIRWTWRGDAPAYGSPVAASLGGTRQIVAITKGMLVGLDAATGALLWERPWESPNFTNSNTPVVTGDLVIVSGNGPPTTAFRVRRQGAAWTVETAWENADVPMRLSDAVLAGDTLFGLSTRNSGQYFAVDVATGKTLWTSDGRQAQHAAIARAGDLLLSMEEDGELVVLRNSRTGFEELRRYAVSEEATWPQPSYSGNRIFVKDVSSLALWTLD